MHLRRAMIATMILLPLLPAGCGSDKPTRLYVLSAMEEPAPPAVGPGVAIGVGPITLPKYLDRPQIVTRLNGNSLAQADLDQWGGDLNDNMTRVLAANLADLLGTKRVSLYPWKDQAPVDYQVTVDVTRFEQDSSGGTILSAFWSINNPADGKVLLMNRSTYKDAGTPATPGAAPGASGARPYDAAAAGMSRDLESLSREIAKAITALKAS